MKARAGSAVLGVPSWVIPGTYAENLRFLDTRQEIEGVELLFFLYDDEISAQLENEWEEIQSYAKRFVFTAHLPEVLLPSHSVLIARLAPFVRHFIVHPSKENPMDQASLLAKWSGRYAASFLAENTEAGLLEALLPHLDKHPEMNAGICMDTGHLLMEGQNPADFYKRHRERIGEIHLHAVDRKQAAIDNRLADHRQLRKDESWLIELLSLLGDYRGIINLEMFSWEEVRASTKVLNEIFESVQ